MTRTELTDEVGAEVSDAELSALALAADPDVDVPADAVPFAELTGTGPSGPLPAWYMPAAGERPTDRAGVGSRPRSSSRRCS